MVLSLSNASLVLNWKYAIFPQVKNEYLKAVKKPTTFSVIVWNCGILVSVDFHLGLSYLNEHEVKGTDLPSPPGTR